jgi:large subunit ribosomal protein L25
MLTLKGEERSAKTKLASIRAEGFIPAVYYGHKEKSTPCVFSLKDFKKVWNEAGESTVVELQMPKGKMNALIHEVYVDPVRGVPMHADFYVLEKGQEVEVAVPLEFVGVSIAIKDLGGALVKVLHELEIKAQPENLPHGFKIDIGALDTLDSQILAGSVPMPKGVTLVTDPEDVIAAISVAEEEPVEAPVMDISSIEVEKKGKEAAEGEEEAPAEKK